MRKGLFTSLHFRCEQIQAYVAKPNTLFVYGYETCLHTLIIAHGMKKKYTADQNYRMNQIATKQRDISRKTLCFTLFYRTRENTQTTSAKSRPIQANVYGTSEILVNN